MPADTIRLTRGGLRLEIHPKMGGSIVGFDWSDGKSVQPILRHARTARDVLEAASFPLVPFVNRIRDGRFAFLGREIRLAPNMAGDPNPLHGQGWLNAWQVGWASELKAVLRFHHRAGEWPWDYEARQEFTLDERGVSLRLACRNESSEPMPCGLGQHPYFPCGPETLIDTDVQCAWTIDEQVLPVDKVPAEGRFALQNRAICAQDLDNGFGGWSGKATISDPAWPVDLRLSSPHARYFHIYSPPGGRFFAAEPVSHANAALNAPDHQWEDHGIRILEPGEEMTLDLRIDVVEKRRASI